MQLQVVSAIISMAEALWRLDRRAESFDVIEMGEQILEEAVRLASTMKEGK